MPQAIGQILPIAVALALSSVPITATVLILLSPNRGRSALPFLLGWVIGLALVVTLCALGAEAVPASRSPRRPDTAIGIAEIVIGAVLLVVAVVSWFRGRHREEPEMPKWLTSVSSLKGWEAFGLAAVMNLRPKGILLALAAGFAIRAETLEPGQSAIVILIYTAIAASTVVTPIIMTLVDPDGMTPRLNETREWLTRNGSAVGALVLAVIAAVIIGSGLEHL